MIHETDLHDYLIKNFGSKNGKDYKSQNNFFTRSGKELFGLKSYYENYWKKSRDTVIVLRNKPCD